MSEHRLPIRRWLTVTREFQVQFCRFRPKIAATKKVTVLIFALFWPQALKQATPGSGNGPNRRPRGLFHGAVDGAPAVGGQGGVELVAK